MDLSSGKEFSVPIVNSVPGALLSFSIRKDRTPSWRVDPGVATANNALAASNPNAIAVGWIDLSKRFISTLNSDI